MSNLPDSTLIEFEIDLQNDKSYDSTCRKD